MLPADRYRHGKKPDHRFWHLRSDKRLRSVCDRNGQGEDQGSTFRGKLVWSHHKRKEHFIRRSDWDLSDRRFDGDRLWDERGWNLCGSGLSGKNLYLHRKLQSYRSETAQRFCEVSGDTAECSHQRLWQKRRTHGTVTGFCQHICFPDQRPGVYLECFLLWLYFPEKYL